MKHPARSLLEALEASFADALRTPEGVAKPVAILWADPERQWAPLLGRLQVALPQLFALGTYSPERRTGPAIWLRCVVDRAVPEMEISSEIVPILYLPGVARQDLRAAEDCPRAFQPLVELQFRGRMWHQRNGRDWTVEAFLVSEDGLALDVAQDAKTREAAQRSLPFLGEIAIDGLRGHRLESDDFDKLAVSDPTRDLLRWMGAGDLFRTTEGDARWKAFCSVCNSEFQFDPDKNSPADATSTLAEGRGKWEAVWQRFKEAPRLYPGLAQLLRESLVPLLQRQGERDGKGNGEAEARLRKELEGVAQLPHADALKKISALEAEHGKRRGWLWAQLDESPLAGALEPLSRVAQAAAVILGGSTIEAVVLAYTAGGWRCDRAVLEALCSVTTPADVALVSKVLRALYLPWLDASARHFQALVLNAESAVRASVTGSSQEKDACLLFSDGLRFDVATMVADRLSSKGYRTSLGHRLAPLPTVTATAKPMATAAHDRLEGGEDIIDFNPRFKDSAQAATALRLREEMEGRGVDMLGEEIRAAKHGAIGGWIETGHLDELGHKLDARLASHLDTEIETLVDQIARLLDCGWRKVRIVTDHGWLLVPGGLPQISMPMHLAATKWSRCATVKGESKPDVPVYSWYWNAHVRIASPPGAGVFGQYREYSHGGVSPQECVVPDLIVERGGTSISATIASVSWRGMRCRVVVETNDPSVRIDIRLNWKQASTSVAAATKEIGPAGEASLAIADDSHEGAAATVVVIDATGNVLNRMPTTVGEST